MQPSKHFDFEVDVRAGKETRKSALTTYIEAVDAITKAAAKFKVIATDDSETEPNFMSTNEDNPYSARLPVGAFCLRLAHNLWRDVQIEMSVITESEAPKDQEVSPESAIVSIATCLDYGERQRIIETLQSMNESADSEKE